MKKIFAILVTICMFISMFSISSFAALLTDFDAAPVGTLLRVTANKGEETVLVGDYDNFEDGWNEAMELAGDEDKMEDNGYDRIVVDLYADWKADSKGEFGSGDGFDNDTIYIPEDAKITLNLNGYTINRGLTEDIDDGEVMFINDDADVIINDGTITGGYSNSEGGALYIEGAKVTLNNVNIVGNKVYNDDGAGIAMYDGASLTMTGGSFQNNILSGSTFDCYGGAIYINDSIAAFNGVTFKNNVTKYDHYYGAAIYADNGIVTINECIFDGNGIEDKANEILAAISIIHATDSSLTVKKTSFTNNGDMHYVNKGHGIYDDVSTLIYLKESDLVMEGCGINRNTLGYIIQTTVNSGFFVSDTNMTDNNAIVLKSTGHAIGSYFNGCTFGDNITSSYVGEKYPFLKYSFNVENTVTVFYNCDMGNSTYSAPALIRFVNENLESGVVLTVSALKSNGTTVKLEEYRSFEEGWAAAMRLATDSYWMNIENNYDAVVVDMHTDWVASKGRFTNATINGIGFNSDTIHVSEGACLILNMNGYKIDRGLTTNEANGEVMYIAYDADITINNGTITGGYSDNGAGGIHITSGAKVTLNNVNVVGNKVEDDDGGGIAVYGGTLVMNGGSVSNNVVECFAAFTTLCGGGINAEDSTVILTDVTIENNTYKPEGFFSDNGLDGAAIAADDSTVIMKNCSVKNNGIPNEEDEEYSNYIIYAEDSTLVIENTNFIGNGVRHSWRVSTSETYNGSSVICAYRSSLDMSGGNFTDNNMVFLMRISDTVVNVEGVDFTGNNSLSLYAFLYSVGTGTFTNCKFSKGPEYVYYKGNALYNSRTFEDDFIFNDSRASLKFVDCDFGDATFSSKRIATFVGCNVSNDIGSIFGEGSLTMIISILALIASGTAIFLVVYYNKKKAAPVAANNAAEAEEE